jgi:hypothetical protein
MLHDSTPPGTNKDEDRKLCPIIHRKQGNNEDPRAKSVGQDPRVSTKFQTRKQVELPTNYYEVEVRNISVPRIQKKSRKRLGVTIFLRYSLFPFYS